jgi:hypothetical protein
LLTLVWLCFFIRKNFSKTLAMLFSTGWEKHWIVNSKKRI